MVKSEPIRIPLTDPVDQFLVHRWQEFSGPVDAYRWPWETARWHELVFCLLLRAGQPQLDADEARKITDVLAGLDMLRVDSLAARIASNGLLDPSQRDVKLMLGLLDAAGVESERATKAVTAVCETAGALVRGFDGKVQRYLRLYADRMVAELSDHFAITGLPQDDVRYAFTHWLQNVADLPLARSGPELERVSAHLGVKPGDVIRAADRLDLNLALLDDILVDDVVLEPESESRRVSA